MVILTIEIRVRMTAEYYEKIDKNIILATPERYAWNSLLCYVQFTQEEILKVREWMVMKSLIRYQKSATYDFLETYFHEEIDECLEVDWNDVELYSKDRG